MGEQVDVRPLSLFLVGRVVVDADGAAASPIGELLRGEEAHALFVGRVPCSRSWMTVRALRHVELRPLLPT
jgi:hypothetical protein